MSVFYLYFCILIKKSLLSVFTKLLINKLKLRKQPLIVTCSAHESRFISLRRVLFVNNFFPSPSTQFIIKRHMGWAYFSPQFSHRCRLFPMNSALMSKFQTKKLVWRGISIEHLGNTGCEENSRILWAILRRGKFKNLSRYSTSFCLQQFLFFY